jgi:hypothetical protein
MNIEPIDLTGLVAVVLGCLMLLIPIAGLTARFALKPVVEAIARVRDTQNSRQAMDLLERRLDLMEHQLQQLDSSVSRIGDEMEFLRQLANPEAARAVTGGRG